jgi:hypothetical protein
MEERMKEAMWMSTGHPLLVHDDPRLQVLTIEGVKYSYDFFRALGDGGLKIGSSFRIVKSAFFPTFMLPVMSSMFIVFAALIVIAFIASSTLILSSGARTFPESAPILLTAHQALNNGDIGATA